MRAVVVKEAAIKRFAPALYCECIRIKRGLRALFLPRNGIVRQKARLAPAIFPDDTSTDICDICTRVPIRAWRAVTSELINASHEIRIIYFITR